MSASRLIPHFLRNTGLRERFALAMGVFVISTGLAVTLLMESRLSTGLRESAHQRLSYVARDLAKRIEEDLSERRLEVSRLAIALSSSDGMSARPMQQVLDGLRARVPAYAWIGLTDAKGRVLAASEGLLHGVDASARPWFIGGREGDFFGDPHVAKLLAQHLPVAANGEPPRFFDIASPVRGIDGRTQGVLGAHLFSEWIRQLVENALDRRIEARSLEVLVADHAGDWLYKGYRGMGDNLSGLLQDSTEGRYLLASEKLHISTHGEALAWTVVVREETRHAFAPVYENRRQMMIATPLLAGMLAFAAWLVAGRMARPVERLAETARRHAAASGLELDDSVARSQDEARLLDHTLSRLALTDSLTGLLNRSALRQRLEQFRKAAHDTKGPAPYALLLLNLDDFHVFNNARGRDLGDQMLRAVAARLQQLTDFSAVVRLGGDEFALLIAFSGVTFEEAARQARASAERVLGAFAAPFELAGGAYRCQASVGIALVCDDTTTPEEALTQAELAMQEAKRLGKGQAAAFDANLQDGLIARASLEQELRDAIPSQLSVLYQPQVDQHRRMIGAELLVRWRHPQHGTVSPASFIPVAERTGLIIDIGRWVLEQACRQIRSWQDDPQRRQRVLAVNVSSCEFSHPDYVDSVRAVLASTGADPTRLKLELTESALAVDINAVVERMNVLKKLGIRFALDDFGTGFSSLSYLHRMPIDQLKIDQTFVREMLIDNGSASIVRTVIALGDSLGLELIAEGVETEAQHRCLAELGCFNYQGYLFGKPVPVEELGA